LIATTLTTTSTLRPDMNWGQRLANKSIPNITTMVYPDLLPPSIPDPEEESCYTSWYSYLVAFRKTKYSREPHIVSHTQVWETIRSFGPNSTYTDCHGITRIKLTSNVTRTAISSVTATVWREYKRDLYVVDGPKPPVCGFQESHMPYLCHKLYTAERGEIGTDSEPFDDTVEVSYPMELACPVYFRCSAHIDEVVLIYWPQAIISQNTCSLNEHSSSMMTPWNYATQGYFTTEPAVISMDAITFRGQDLYLRKVDNMDWRAGFNGSRNYQLDEDFYDEIRPLLDVDREYIEPSVMKGPWTFTFPTVYLAHRPITRRVNMFNLRDGGEVSTDLLIRTAGIITLRPEDVFTRRPNYSITDGVEYEKLVANGSFHPTLVDTERLGQTLPLDFGHLQDPVPASAYYDARMLDCWGQQSHCQTITDDSFRPKLRIARRVWKSIFSGITCEDPMINDPPLALTALNSDSVEIPQIPVEPSHTTSTPAQFHQNPGSFRRPDGHPDRPSHEPRPGHAVGSPYPVETSSSGKNKPQTDYPYAGVEPQNGNHQPLSDPEHKGSAQNGDNGNRGIMPEVFNGVSSRTYMSPSYLFVFCFALAGMVQEFLIDL
jgi:hypothetical protein